MHESPALHETRSHLKNISAALVVLVTILVLVGFVTDITLLQRLSPGFSEMKANTAGALLSGGIALWLTSTTRDSSRRRIAAALAFVTFLIGTVTLCEYLVSTDIGLDTLLFNIDRTASVGPYPGRMSPHAAVNLTLLGGAIVLLNIWRPLEKFSDLLAIAAMGVTFITVLGHLYGAQQLYGVSQYNSMALNTAFACAVMGFGTLAANRNSSLVSLITGNTLGGTVARRLLPVAILVPTVAGWLRIQGQEAGLYGTGFGAALSIVVSAGLLCGFTYYFSRMVHHIDIQRTDAESRLADKEQRYRHIVDHGQGMICTHDRNGVLEMVNPAALAALGYSADEVVGHNLRDFMPPNLREGFEVYLRKITNEGLADGLLRLTAKNGTIVTWRFNNVLLTEEDREPYVLGHAQDVTEILKAQDELRNLSLTDELTGLYNRRGFLTLADQQIRLEKHSGTARGVILMFADMDGLKKINDNYGHDAGSHALVELSKILKSVTRSTDLVARLGGDEFAILGIGLGEDDAHLMTDRIRERLLQYNAQSNKPYEIACSIGIAPDALDGSKPLTQIIAEADEAMYKEKQRRKAASVAAPDELPGAVMVL